MLRYIKVNDNGIDTLKEHLENGKTYILIDAYVYVIYRDGSEDCEGELEDECDSF